METIHKFISLTMYWKRCVHEEANKKKTITSQTYAQVNQHFFTGASYLRFSIWASFCILALSLTLALSLYCAIIYRDKQTNKSTKCYTSPSWLWSCQNTNTCLLYMQHGRCIFDRTFVCSLRSFFGYGKGTKTTTNKKWESDRKRWLTVEKFCLHCKFSTFSFLIFCRRIPYCCTWAQPHVYINCIFIFLPCVLRWLLLLFLFRGAFHHDYWSTTKHAQYSTRALLSYSRQILKEDENKQTKNEKKNQRCTFSSSANATKAL